MVFFGLNPLFLQTLNVILITYLLLMKDLLFYAVPAMGIVGLLYTLLKFSWVANQPAGNDRMKEISTYIAEGAMAFLKAEWKILGYFVVIVA
jgi:K(+)-stimulated pyrophosphate-energized sodium pump